MRATKLGAAAVVCLFAVSCSNSNGGEAGSSGSPAPSGSAEASASASASPTSITIGSDTANDHGEANASGKSSLDVEQDDFYFGPTVITGTPGQKLTIELDNEGSVTHNFTIDSLNIDQDVPAGSKMEVTVTFPDSGITEFYCAFHRSQGMVGELTVS
jgi:plastocyanin